MRKIALLTFVVGLIAGCDGDKCGPPGSALDCGVDPEDAGAINVLYSFDGDVACDALGIDTLEVTVLPSGNSEPLTLDQPCDDEDFEVGGLPEGSTDLQIRGVDNNGHTWEGSFEGALVAIGQTIPVDIVLSDATTVIED